MNGPSGRVQIAWLSPTYLYVRVEGLGTMYSSAGMAKFFDMAVKERCRDITVDLRDCSGMDSTFMGILAGVAQSLNEQRRGGVSIVNVSDKCKCLLECLGLHYVLNIKGGDLPAPPVEFQDLPQIGALDFREKLEVLKKAHQRLAELNEKNRSEFEPFLRHIAEEEGEKR